MGNSAVHINRWLLPLSWLYGIGVGIRNKLFDWGILPSRNFDIPVIAVGNISVGGTGKTPHTEYLIRLLRQEKFQVAVLSRGYKRKSKGFVMADGQSRVEQIGDEPCQMKRKYPFIYMAVDENRSRGIERLSDEQLNPLAGVVLLDDAYQHRYVSPGLNILLMDYHRPLNEDALLPAGRLREPERNKNRANIVIITKCPRNLKPMDFRVIIKYMNLYPYQKLYFSALRYGTLVPVFPEALPRSQEGIDREEYVLLLTGIASPRQLLDDLSIIPSHVRLLSFPDHHAFTPKDLCLIRQTFEAMEGGDRRLIVTTEKDAARLSDLSLDEEVRQHLYALPVEVEFLSGQGERFNQDIISYVRTNSRDSILLKGKNVR